MKTLTLLSVAFLLTSANSFALPMTTPIEAESTQFGFCGGFDFSFCSQQIIDRANQYALDQASEECSVRQGQAAANGDCYANCFPIFLPYNAPTQSVNCTSRCTLDCTTK